jgi:hypothetical protein
VLARIPGGIWRTTCLYRSVAECMVLVRLGVPAVLRIGVCAGAVGHAPSIAAHAWVEREGLTPISDMAEFHPLRFHTERRTSVRAP